MIARRYSCMNWGRFLELLADLTNSSQDRTSVPFFDDVFSTILRILSLVLVLKNIPWNRRLGAVFRQDFSGHFAEKQTHCHSWKFCNVCVLLKFWLSFFFSDRKYSVQSFRWILPLLNFLTFTLYVHQIATIFHFTLTFTIPDEVTCTILEHCFSYALMMSLDASVTTLVIHSVATLCLITHCPRFVENHVANTGILSS